jgi:hypothetical protein
MGSTDQQATSQKPEYLTKKVILNGQFVTLYSLNGQTWLSSPEEIPEVMARLENTRVTLTPEQQEVQEQEESKEAAPGEKKAADKKAGDKAQGVAQPPIQLASKYRLKGPKPRPILRQNGMVFKGTPVEPISSSEVQVKVADGKAQQKAPKGLKQKAKLKAPVLAEARAAAAAAKVAAKGKGKKGSVVEALKQAAGKQAPLSKQTKQSSLVKAALAAKKAKAAAPAAKATKASPKKAQPAKKPSAAKLQPKAAKSAAKKKGKAPAPRRSR